jgi:hypothetical protein
MEDRRLGRVLSEWATELAELIKAGDQFRICGILTCTSQILKLGHRKALQSHLDVFVRLMQIEVTDTLSTMHKKLHIKMVQRIGLMFMPVVVATWRYDRGQRSLAQNLKRNKEDPILEPASGQGEALPSLRSASETELDELCAARVEDVLGQLIQFLGDAATVVRWSCAKGIGRMVERLPSEMGDDVVASVLECFDSRNDDGLWHGGCLALAELASRGLLLVPRLADVVPLVLDALVYEQRRGASSVGAHVRDAACYVCWAFARAYTPDHMQLHVTEIARQLITVAVFDREINCRRAASAAFQENVGRQGSFPHGIDIVTAADYFTVGNRTNAYLKIAVYIAEFDDYRRTLVSFLLTNRLQHWDKPIRELAAQALREIVRSDPSLFTSFVLPATLENSTAADVVVRHGNALGTAEVIRGLHQAGVVLADDLRVAALDLVATVDKMRLYRGKGGEVMREAVMEVVASIAEAQLPLSKLQHKAHLGAIMECLKSANVNVMLLAVNALEKFSATNFSSSAPEPVRMAFFDQIMGILRNDDNPAAVRGACRGIGVLSKAILAPKLADALEILALKTTTIQASVEDRDTETRQYAMYGLIGACKQVGPEEISSELLQLVERTILAALKDYCVDNRGDVGSAVRQAAMEAGEQLCQLMSQEASVLEPARLSAEFMHGYFGALTGQAAEKIDRVREQAGTTIVRLLQSKQPVILGIPHREFLEQVLLQSQVDWNSASTTFSVLVRLLETNPFRTKLLEGLAVSVGDSTESLARHSWASIESYITTARDQVPRLQLRSTLWLQACD